MPRVHDRGGWPTDEPIDPHEHQLMDWERRVDALHGVLGARGLRSVDEMRRAIEGLEPTLYESLSYYEKWTAALEVLLLEKGVLTRDEIDRQVDQLNGRE
jgi:hypothetical protein